MESISQIIRKITGIGAISGLFCLHALQAADPIFIFAVNGGAPPQEIRIGGSGITELITEVTERKGEFIAFAGQSFNANLTYLGVKNAILFDFSADGKSATVRIPAANFQRTFTAADADRLSDDLEGFLRTEGSGEISQLRRYVNSVSPAGVTDGNPLSTTAQISSNWVEALDLDFDRHDHSASKHTKNHIRLDFSQTSYQAADFSGSLTAGRFRLSRDINERVEIVAVLPFNYQLIENSELIGVGAGLSIPVTLIGEKFDAPLRWKLSPLLGGMFRISEDLASGGGVLAYGLNSTLAYQVNERLAIAGIAQYNHYDGIPIDIEGYELDHVVNQGLLMLGTQISYQYAKQIRFGTHLHGMHYLEDAAVQEWINLGASVQYQFNSHTSLRGSYERTEGDDFDSNRFALNLAFDF